MEFTRIIKYLQLLISVIYYPYQQITARNFAKIEEIGLVNFQYFIANYNCKKNFLIQIKRDTKLIHLLVKNNRDGKDLIVSLNFVFYGGD